MVAIKRLHPFFIKALCGLRKFTDGFCLTCCVIHIQNHGSQKNCIKA